MSIVNKIKDELSGRSQKALGLDGIRYSLQVALEKLERLHQIESKLAQLEAMSASTNDQFHNLKTFLTWYSNRVEPWFWTGNFSQADPEQELAGFLLNFLSGRVLLHLGSPTDGFAKAAAEIGYEVRCIEPPDSIGSQAASNGLPNTIDFLNATHKNIKPAVVTALDSIHPAVIQTEFVAEGFETSDGPTPQRDPLSASELIKDLRHREYFWNVIIFRTEAEGFIRMGTNLASVPEQAWGKLVFFCDHQLFLKAFHWCKTTLPRFRAARLTR